MMRSETGAAAEGSPAIPRWEPDFSSDKCGLCGEGFWLFRRRHHCRKCGQLVCGSCSTSRIPTDFTSKATRACDKCVGFEKPARAAAPAAAESQGWFWEGWCQARPKGSAAPASAPRAAAKKDFYWDKEHGWVRCK
eukprot:TRINITY_DN9083_c0_g1_i2.p1 TRINITY_DN9083_c0_g1~~TRINITY_DN9083_c0_g1_i2.p1  ORF type:complete len:136 (-),score=10.29 TRINITY_DN9083_c0_g1_i2:190-597(-)